MMALIIMAVEIGDKVIEHEKPTRYSELVFEHQQKVKQLKVLQEEIDELDAIIKAINNSIEYRSSGNFYSCNHVWGTNKDSHKNNLSPSYAICVKCGRQPIGDIIHCLAKEDMPEREM